MAIRSLIGCSDKRAAGGHPVAWLLLVGILFSAYPAGCSSNGGAARPGGGQPPPSTPSEQRDASAGGTSGTGGTPVTKADASSINVVPTDGARCVPAICDPPGAHYCGVIGDGCDGKMDCGSCMGDETCQD